MNPAPTIRRIMSISQAEFLRSLKPLAKTYPYRIAPTERTIHLKNGQGEIVIRLGKERCKKLGALELPEMIVDFLFHEIEPESVERFLYRFDLCFRRGGG